MDWLRVWLGLSAWWLEVVLRHGPVVSGVSNMLRHRVDGLYLVSLGSCI
jgi:hypothetical protein